MKLPLRESYKEMTKFLAKFNLSGLKWLFFIKPANYNHKIGSIILALTLIPERRHDCTKDVLSCASNPERVTYYGRQMFILKNKQE